MVHVLRSYQFYLSNSPRRAVSVELLFFLWSSGEIVCDCLGEVLLWKTRRIWGLSVTFKPQKKTWKHTKKKSQSAFSSPEVMVIKLKHVSLHQVMCDTICTLFISLTPYNSGPECCYSRSCHWDTNRFICFVCGLFHSLSLSPVMRPGWPDKCPRGYQTNVTFLFTARVSFSSHTRTTLFFSKSVPFNLLQNLPYDLLLSSVSIHCDRLTSPCYRWWADDSRFKYTSLHQHCLT